MSAALLRKARPLDDEYGLHAIPLSLILFDKIGAEVLLWDSTALHEELEDAFGSIGIVTWERIHAMRLLHSHDMAWREWEVFENVVAAIMGEGALFSHVQPPEPEEMAVAIEVMKKVDSHPFSPEVQGYIAASCLFDGLWYLYDTPLEFAQDEIHDLDRRQGIERNYGGVAAVLANRDSFLDPPETSADVQANRVLEVRLVLKRYNAIVDKQLLGLPKLLGK